MNELLTKEEIEKSKPKILHTKEVGCGCSRCKEGKILLNAVCDQATLLAEAQKYADEQRGEDKEFSQNFNLAVAEARKRLEDRSNG